MAKRIIFRKAPSSGGGGGGGMPAGQLKFFPGDYMNTAGVLFGTGAMYTSEIAAFAAKSSGFQGYGAMWTWHQLEDFTATTNHCTNTVAGIDQQYPGFGGPSGTNANSIEVVANALWAAVSSAKLIISIQCEIGNGSGIGGLSYITKNFSSSPTSAPVPAWVAQCGGNLTIPDYFGASTTSLYSGPVAPIYSGAGYYGFIFSQLISSTDFFDTLGAFHNPAVNQSRIQMVQALLGYKFKTGPYAGYTIDACPGIALLMDNAENSYAVESSQNVSGVTVNPPPTSGPYGTSATCSQTTWRAAVKQWYSAIRTAAKQTPVVICQSYGMTTSAGSDTPATLASQVNALLSPYDGLSQIYGLCMGDSDIFDRMWNFDGNGINAGPSQLGYIGYSNGTGAAGTPVPKTAQDLTGKMCWAQQIQPYDYTQSYYLQSQSPAVVNGMIQQMDYVKVSYRIWSCGDNTNFGVTAWNGTTANWNTNSPVGIHDTVVANSTKASSLLPQNFMYGPTIPSPPTVNGPSSITVPTPAITGQGTGLTLLVYRNGAQVGSVTPGNSFTDTGLASGTTYAYSLAMQNSNGIGPQGPAVHATTF